MRGLVLVALMGLSVSAFAGSAATPCDCNQHGGQCGYNTYVIAPADCQLTGNGVSFKCPPEHPSPVTACQCGDEWTAPVKGSQKYTCT